MAKKTPAKKPTVTPSKKAAAAKPALKASAKAPAKVKTASLKTTPAKTPVKIVEKMATKIAAKPVTEKVAKAASKAAPVRKAAVPSDRILAQQFARKPAANKNDLTPFLVRQRQRLLDLKDTLLDSMRGVARDNLHAGSETSAFGMHQADAGSDAYDRDFALSMLSKEQGSLYEIDEALKRIEDGSYGVCDICEKPIRHDRLEALPFTRYTVECQAELEKRQHHHSVRPHINSLFGLTEEEAENEEEESNDNN